MRIFLVSLALAGLTTAVALADPAGDLNKALGGFGNVTSYHMSMESGKGQKGEGDFVKPDKMHMMMGPMEMITVAGGSYVKANGSWMKMPGGAMPAAGMGPFEYVRSMGSLPPDVAVTDLGTKTVDGKSLHAYKVAPKGSKPTTMYLDGAGMLARIDTIGSDGTSIIRFSKFNAPIKIVAPI